MCLLQMKVWNIGAPKNHDPIWNLVHLPPRKAMDFSGDYINIQIEQPNLFPKYV